MEDQRHEETQRSARTCLLSFCGLPGAGKTTLAKRLVRYLTEKHPNVLPKLISFDEVGEQAGLDEEYSPEVWKANRRKAHSLVESELKQDLDVDAACQPRESWKGEKLVIVDDNMHLRSMRRQLYLLARKHRTAFITLYVETPLSVALESNNSREKKNKVPMHVITKMNHDLEVPDGKRNKWESKSIRTSGFSQGLECVWEQIDKLWQEPVPPEDEHLPAPSSSSSSSSSCGPSLSEIHQFDLLKRKEVTSMVQEWRQSGLPKSEIQARVRRANEERKRALADFKCRTNVK